MSQQQGDDDHALIGNLEARAIRRRTLGEGSIDVAAPVGNQSQTHHQQGSLDMAIQYYTELLWVAQSMIGANHPDIAIIYKCLAEFHHGRMEREVARDMYEKALSVCRVAIGPYQPEMASILNRLGNLCFEMEDLDSALAYYTEGLNVEKRGMLDSVLPHVIGTMMNIAQIHRQRGNYAEALMQYTEIHALQLKKNGPTSIELASTLSYMGLMEYQMKSYLKAFNLYQGCLRIQRDHYKSDDHIDIAYTINAIGLVLFRQGMLTLAKEYCSRSLRFQIKLLGPNHPDIAIMWYNLASIHHGMGEDDLAVKLYQETLRIKRLAHGNKHHNVVMTLEQLGLVHQQRGELNEALRYFCEALEIERSIDGSSSIVVGKMLNLIGNLHLQRNNVGLMMQCYTEASRIYKQLGHNEALVIAGYNFFALSKLHPPCAMQA